MATEFPHNRMTPVNAMVATQKTRPPARAAALVTESRVLQGYGAGIFNAL